MFMQTETKHMDGESHFPIIRSTILSFTMNERYKLKYRWQL